MIRILAMLAMHALVARTFTTQTDQTATTALGIVFRLETMALFVGLGWGSAAQTFVGQNLGAGNGSARTMSGWVAAPFTTCARWPSSCSSIGAPGFRVVRFFDDDPAWSASRSATSRVVAPSYLALGVGIVLGSAMTGAGATRTTMLIDLAVICAFGIAFALVATSFDRPSPMLLWVVVAATNVLGAVVYTSVYRRGTFLQRAFTV